MFLAVSEGPPAEAQVPLDDGTQEVTLTRGGTSVRARVLRSVPDPATGRPMRPGSIVVKFHATTSASARTAAHTDAGAAQVENLLLSQAQRVQVPPAETARALSRYRARPEVEYAEPDYIYRLSYQPNDTQLASQWALPKMGAPAAWDVTQSSSAVRIAVLDCGILSASSAWGDANGFPDGHPDVGPKVIAEVNFSVSSSVDDFCNHGTHVAGIASAVTNNATGIAGMAPNARLLNVKVCDDEGNCSSSAILNGLTYASGCDTSPCGNRRAEVINMSFGGAGGCSTARQDAINKAWTQGLVLAAAAGNDGVETPNTPANCVNVLSVAASDQNDLKAGFSNYGSWVDVAAPGASILSANFTGTYSYLSGTSMATPYVAGLAALLWTTPHNTGNAAIVNRITATAKTSAPAGSVYGRIDAAAAVGSEGGLLAPSNVTLGQASNNSLTVFFKDNATNETGVDIERKTGAAGQYSVVITSNPLPGAQDGWWWPNSGLDPGTQYCYRLRAKNGTSFSPFSAEVCGATTGSPGGVPAPSNLIVGQATSGSLTVSFKDNASNELGVEIERKTGAGGQYSLVITSNPLPGTQDGWYWTDTSLSAGTQYCYRLRTKAPGPAFSAYTQEVCASTSGSQGGGVPAPSNVFVSLATSNSLAVFFKDNANNEEGVEIERRTSTTQYAPAITTNPLPGAQDGWYWPNTGLSPNTQYCYRLRTRVPGPAYSAYTSEVCATTLP